MTKFISNVNKYMSEMKIKQSYLGMITGIDKNKMLRILNGSQDVSDIDMEKIAHGLGKSVEFFLMDPVSNPQIEIPAMSKAVFYADEPSQKQKQLAEQLMELLENIDEVMSAKIRFKNVARG